MVNSTDAARLVAERYRTAWIEGDIATVLDCYADDIVLHYFGSNQISGDHIGKAAAIDAITLGATLATRELIRIEEIMAGPGTAVIVARERLTREGETHVVSRLLRYRIAADRFAECWLHEEDQALIDHLWR